ncbi:conjugal transfer protein TraO [Klebsiella sp. PL-2018]|uniref:conjugal transfer protein TraO n=1 Tax=Klebsiella TaxID=570 RepID=UPI001C214647|nr:conjugal transfer protein TraO [Klebsiella sp. PL-2018]QXD00991.1 IncI1 plasmid conjugative transfer protein TraO [Klebsiella sp. PL-2018]
MSEEQEAGSSGKKLFSLIGLGLLTVLGGGYLLISWLGPQNDAGASAVNLNRATSGSGGSTPESPRYRELLKADNEQGAAAAKRQHTTFIASLPMGLDSHETPAPPVTPPPTSPRETTPTPPASGDTRAEDEKRQARLQQLLSRLRAHQTGQAPVVAKAMWGGATPRTTASLTGESVAVSAGAGSNRGPVTIIPALTRVPATIDTAINSDNAESQVTATLQAGPWKGAVLHSPGVKLAGNGVQIHFTSMSWRGLPLKVNAWAQRESDLQSSVATDVSHHWVTQIVLPSLLSGGGDLGKLYRDANTRIVQGNFGDVTSRVGSPDGAAVAGVMLGGTAQRGSEVLTKALGDVPFKQVNVAQGEVISVLFVDAVTDTTPAVSPAQESLSASDVRSSGTQTSWDVQRRLQNISETRRAEMRQRYPWQEEQ